MRSVAIVLRAPSEQALRRSEQLRVRAQRLAADRYLLRLDGELDLATAPLVHDEVRRLRSEGSAVRLDLAGLEFFDSIGLTLLLRLAADARRDGWALELTDPPPCVEHVVGLTGTRDALPFL